MDSHFSNNNLFGLYYHLRQAARLRHRAESALGVGKISRLPLTVLDGRRKLQVLKKVLRITAGVLLICTVFPPVIIGVLNIFVLALPALGVVLIMLPSILHVLKAHLGRHYKRFMTAVCIVMITAGAFYAAEFCLIFSNSFQQKAPENSVVIVLGAKVEGNHPTLILLGRINAAGKYLCAHPNTVCIACGGQSSDESISEAHCIKDWLVEHYDIAPLRIRVDDKSISTAQNIDNAAALIKTNKLPTNVIIATDGFHLFRAKLLVLRRGLKPYSLPAKTTKALVIELYVRELIGLPKSILFNR